MMGLQPPQRPVVREDQEDTVKEDISMHEVAGVITLDGVIREDLDQTYNALLPGVMEAAVVHCRYHHLHLLEHMHNTRIIVVVHLQVQVLQ